jgi:hypothetical protein
MCHTRTLGQLNYVISSYISQEGNYPQNESALMKKLLIKKNKDENNSEYFMRSAFFNPDMPRDPNGWIRIWDFDLFKISYGVNINNIKVMDGKLYDKITGNQILLIDGPCKKYLQSLQYEPISLGWYKLMLQERKPVNEQQATNNSGE